MALAAFAPVILWNAEHHWVSFLKQMFGRARIEIFRPAFIAELVPTQVAFATPLASILGAMGLHALIWRNTGAFAARMLVNTMFWTIVAYFIWHSLHARVEANWFAPVIRRWRYRPRSPPTLHAVGQMAPAPRRFLPALGLAGGSSAV